jgi:5-azacytidine-induced protein 1
MEERFTHERKLIVENNSTQNKRQLDFIDQLIKDKQTLAEQLTALAKKIETDEATKKKEIDELNSKHNVEMTSIRDKLTAAEKLRREKWVEAKQKEIKELTVKGLEPEIARLIARHKQELRNIKAEHEAETMAADERAARRWAVQAERLRQAHEEEKIRIAEIERQRAKEKIGKELSQFESDSQIQRDRITQERAIEKERQHQHVEYLKETH